VLYSDPQKNVCPQGWHVPTQPEWQIFINTIVGTEKLFPKNDNLWSIPFPEATDEYGFTVLPSGGRIENGVFGGMGNVTNWHLNNTTNNTIAMYWGLMVIDPNSVSFGNSDIKVGFSIRCIRD
jgi:uncharacterized protein (TIGR02145 family)